ncbi:corticotropin-releasing factor receptor 1 isoform X2 [Phyllostomus hastatus]|uniref:corticotropin-releasing factor receptor 1 isoform X2 n=1 Tax=Phyllostomus hastatus TaxID=9423 RepID=UPI001E67FEF8|nr:corticotropin-releasing factor receptor 1 isoform X2 [Phyllostomus hastatus]
MGRPPQLRLVKALLFLGLNPISASLQDQQCEGLSLASNISGLQCNASVDLIGTCWPQSPAGQLVVRPCPAYFYGVRYNTTNNGYRECLANGSWAARVNYSECQEILSEEKKSKVHYHVAVIINYLGHCVSLVALLVAFVLFLRLRSIRCLRNIIHWNLISAFILRNATWFVVQLTMSPEVHQSNVGWCRLVTAAYNYFHVTNFFWMFGEGCYLHTAIVLTYSTDRLHKWMFICIGWGVPFPIIVAWAIGKLYYDNEKCWFGKRPGVYTDYIYQGPMILVLLINFIFLFNIVRILMTKLRASTTSETIQYRVSSCLCSTVSSTARSALPSGRGGTAGRTSTPSAPVWPGPCPSPPPRPGSAFTASSSPRPSEPEGHGTAPSSPVGKRVARLSRRPCLWRGPAPAHSVPSGALALRPGGLLPDPS